MNIVEKKIIVGVTGGIAAYKTPDLVRRLRDHGAEVRVVMTQGATEFITALTLQAVSGNPVHQYLLDEKAEAGMGHIELAKWADHVVIAPATADIMAKMVQGSANDLLSTILLATKAHVHLVPAMNQQMWQHAAVKRNLAQLKNDGVNIIGPAAGAQACGDVGFGRMMEPLEIVATLEHFMLAEEEQILAGKHVLITAGPTFEALDPVRGLTNRSSGKMGYALADTARALGAQVTLVSGPVCLTPPHGIDLYKVQSALQMHQTVMDCIHKKQPPVDVFIGVAAVSDYRADMTQSQKIKKGADMLKIELVRNPDILSDVARSPDRPFCVGFAAETENMLEYARSKLEHKNIDVIFANHVSTENAVFGSDENAVTMISSDRQVDFPTQSKYLLAKRMLGEVVHMMTKNK